MGKTVSASAISEYLSDERASKKKKTVKLSAPEYKYNDDLESGALDIAKGVGQIVATPLTAGLTMPSGIASVTRGVGKVTGKRNETAEKVTSALAMPSAKLAQGFMGSAEGIYDFIVGSHLQVAGAVSKNEDIKDAAKWVYSNSWSSELSGAKDVDETLKNDSTAYRVTGDVLSGIGNVAFQMGLAMLTMGAANAATAAGSAGALAGNSGMSVGLAKGITYGSLFASAAGSGTAESMSKTGDLGWRENLSGVLKGGVEVATELISPTGQLIGTKFLENAAAKGSAEAAKKLAAKTMGESIKVSTKRALAKKLVSNFAGEATEEMLSYAGGWLIENKLNISDEKFSVQEMLYEGLMGGIAGSIFSSPADVHMFRVNRSTGAAVYAKGDAYAQGKINEGLTLVKLYKEKGVKGGAIDLAEAALTKLATNETLSQTQKEYYMGLAENVVLKTDLSETAKQYATALAERAAADPSYAESVANSLNAIVNEAGGKGEYTAADIANKDSGAARIVTLSQMLSDFVNPSADERIIHSFIDAANNATDWSNSAEQLDAVRNLQVGEDQQLVYKVDYVKDGDVYAVVKKRVDPKTGKESYSLAYTTTGQITSEDPQLYPMHDLSYDEVTSFLEGGLYSEQEVDQMIAEEQDRRETEAEQRREREQARNAEQKPNRKKKKRNAKKNAQTEQTGDQTQANRATQEDLSAFERSMMPKLGIDNSDFTQDEWITARECIPNIDNLTRREQARILTLVRTANATGQNAEYVKGLARLSAAFGFGVVFYPDTKASGFYQRGNDMVFINPGNLDITYGHEIQHSYDQEQKNGVAVYRTDLIEAVKKIVGDKVFEKAKAQYKADYEAFRKETGVRPISEEELEGEASANVVGKYLSNMTLLKKIAATDYSLGRGLLAAIRRMKDKWTSAKAFAKENNSTAFAEYRKMTRIERMLMQELAKRDARKAGDTAYSPATAESDSDGNTLSYGQQKYFAKSKVRDANGRLLVVYHGTDADFDTFDLSRAGKNGRQEGFGFYFAANQEITRKYGDKQKKVYLNIEKPLYDNRRTVTKAELRKFANALVDYQVNENGEDWRDTFISNYVDTYSTNRANAISQFVETVWEANENDQDLIYEIANGSGMNYDVDTMEPFYNVLYQSIGYDGNISTWEYVPLSGKKETNTIYVTFRPEQAKYVSNFEPTSSTDLRFSPASVSSDKTTKPYNFGKSFAEQVDDLEKGVFPQNDTLVMGATPKVFQDIGLLALPMTYTQKHAREAIANVDGDHLGKELLKKVPDSLKNPVAIIDSESIPGRLVAIVEVSGNNRSVIAAVEIDGSGMIHGIKIDSNAITSAHSRSNAITKLLANAVKSEAAGTGGIYYWNKKKATTLARIHGVQFPGTATIVDGSVRSIHDPKSKVKSKLNNIFESKQFKRWFKNSPFKNEDGTPKVYYHGAKKGGGFTVFRDWQYFTDKKQYAERYAERDNPNALYEVYLTADKVFDTRNADARKIFQSIRNEYGLSELQDTGLPDWTDGYDITEYLSEHPELGYDAVILDEGGDLVEGEPVSRGESIIIKDSSQVKSATDNIGTYDRANPDIRYSPVTRETDSRYLSLARDPQKNESELRRLVKEAAEKAGYNSPLLYHGTDYYGKITVFRKGKTGYLGGGIYFTDSETNAKRYAERMGAGTVYSAYLQVKNPLRVSSADPAKEILFAAYGSDRAYNARVQGQGNAAYLVQPKDIKKLQSLGYDGIVWKLAKRTETEYSVFEPSQVKSADPVTYDDSGNIIPLSERFNPQNDDIRYSPAQSGSGRIVIQASQSRPNIQERITNAKGELTRENFRKAVESLKVIAVNAQQGVENQLVRAGMTKREAAAFSQLARSGRSHAINAICYKLADMTGAIRSEGLIQILEPFLATKGEVYPAVDKDGNTVQSTAKGGELAGKRYSEFSDYYAMLHAIDRAAVGKNPYSSMTVAQMKQIVAEYEQKNPDFKAAAEKLSAFNSAMLDIEVQAGIISQETADLWRKQYPHYVPMYTQDSNAVGGKPVRGARNMEVRRDNAAASESDHRVSDPLRNYIDQVQRRIRAAKLNILLNEVYNSADGVNVVTAEADRAEAKDLRERERAYLENPESENDPAEMFRKFKRGKNTVNEVSFYKDGKRVTMAVTDRIYTGLSDLGGIHSSILDSWTVKAVKKVNDTFKKLVTNWNPFFAVKNIARDLQDGTLQSRFGMGEFLNMYRKNAEMMATGKYNDMWEEFLANGGLESSLYSDEFGTFTKGGKSGLEQATGIVGQFQHIKNFNTLTEALPRFTEYCITRKHGGSVQTALLNAADVTVNFGRSGTLIRILNSTVSPFLNPAVQGLDRVIRLFTEDGIKNNKALASLLLKAVLLAIVPMALGNAMYGNDDEYKDMKDSVKENNYLFKIGDTWLKLPRGRVVSTISGLFNRSYKQLTGQETDWGDYGKNVLDQITPAQNVARHIGSPFYDVANNRTWYGTKIESDALQNYAVNQRYDENTSRISVWIGQLTSHFGLSPKEVNYLIDQYTGVIGDILLPTTTPAGTKGVVSYNFTVDPNTSSNLSNRFYDLYNKTMYKSNDGDVEAYYLKKRLDETKSAVSELFKQIKTINASSELSNKEKVKQASAIRASINQLYKTALDDRRLYEQNIKDALAIENSYAVEKITAQSAKRYGLDSDAVGKYALTFGGDFAKQFNTEAQANDYKADAAKKTVYAEANRLTYGAEYALREYNVNVYDKANTLNELGISYDEYYNYYMTARYYSGKTKKQKILAYLNGSGLSKSQVALMMYYSGYTAYADEAKKAIKASSLSAERKKELLAGLTN